MQAHRAAGAECKNCNVRHFDCLMFAYQIDLFKQRAACTECIILKKLAPAAHCSSIELTYKHSAPQGAESKNRNVKHFDCPRVTYQSDFRKQRTACTESIKIQKSAPAARCF